ncbi:MAG: YicC/YloC family endoribonuclease [Cyclobacteriaceae bacterium]
MIYSMTGYGSAQYENDKSTLSVEFRTLNSKFLDLQLKIPKEFSDRELEIRAIITDTLKRGKVVLTIDIQPKGNHLKKLSLDRALFKSYYDDLTSLAREVGDTNHSNLFKIALDMPEVVVGGESEDELVSWDELKAQLNSALMSCLDFRTQEGEALKSKLEAYINSISVQLNSIEEIDPARVERIKSRIRGNLNEFVGSENIDQNRFEQELIYYIEKLDISEEKVRLKNHLDYFTEVITNEELPGKKLAFVSQEIGREINTIGSKANDAAIQRHVVLISLPIS